MDFVAEGCNEFVEPRLQPFSAFRIAAANSGPPASNGCGRSIALLHPLTSVDRMERLPDGTFMSDISSDHLKGGDPGVGNAEG